MTKETVGFGGRWIKSVRWAEGSGFKAKAATFTHVQAEAAQFAPATAAALRRQFGPEARARRAAAEQAVAQLFAQAIDAVSKDMGRDVRSLLKGIL
jgi:hypothetical protein